MRRIDAAFDNSEFSDDEPNAFHLEVVGIGPVPVGDGRTIHGAAITYEGALAGLPPELTEGFDEAPRTNVILVDRADGVSEGAITERFAAEGAAGVAVLDLDEAACEAVADKLRPQLGTTKDQRW